jgi:hypothetical protein
VRRSARNQPLPQTEVTHLLSLAGTPQALKARAYCLYQAGWTLSAIGDPLEKARSTVRSWVLSGPYPHQDDIPYPENKEYVRKRPVSPGIDQETREYLHTLAPIARKYRSKLPHTHSATLANRELTQLVRELHETGVSIQELADATGVTYRAMYRRVRNVY